MGKTAHEIRTEISSEELTEWMAYDQLWHLPDSYWQSGMIAATIGNCHRVKGRAYEVEDFMPKMPKILKQQSQQEIIHHLDSVLGIQF